MLSFLTLLFDQILDWIGLKNYSNVSVKSNSLDSALRDSIVERIEYNKEYIENRKKRSQYNSIHEIYRLLEKDYDLTLPKYETSDNLLDWFSEKIAEANNEKNIHEKIKLLLLKVEVEKWFDIEKKMTDLELKESLLQESLSIDDYIEIINEC